MGISVNMSMSANVINIIECNCVEATYITIPPIKGMDDMPAVVPFL